MSIDANENSFASAGFRTDEPNAARGRARWGENSAAVPPTANYRLHIRPRVDVSRVGETYKRDERTQGSLVHPRSPLKNREIPVDGVRKGNPGNVLNRFVRFLGRF